MPDKIPVCLKCKQPMPWTSLKTKKPVCMVCPVLKANRWIRRQQREELIPVSGWAWKTADGWHASTVAPKPAVVKSIRCKLMLPRKYVE